MRRIAAGMAAALVATVLTTVGGAAPAGAVHVSCGQTITQSTTLDGNVGPCSNNGIIIGPATSPSTSTASGCSAPPPQAMEPAFSW
jgi:hypothetical protein